MALSYPLGITRRVPQGKNVFYPLSTKRGRSRWLDIGLVRFLRVMSVSVHKHLRKELGQYPATLTSRLCNNPNIYSEVRIAFCTLPSNRIKWTFSLSVIQE